jgi:hypothetical protein
MHVSQSRTPRKHASVILLVMALLLAQWSGLAHSINHAYLGGIQAIISLAVDSNHTDDTSSRHSCVAFDAAAVADTLHVTGYAASAFASARTLALWVAFASWDAPLICHFSSRAPPLS